MDRCLANLRECSVKVSKMSIVRLVHIRAFERIENTAVELDPGRKAHCAFPVQVSIVDTSSQCFLVAYSPAAEKGPVRWLEK